MGCGNSYRFSISTDRPNPVYFTNEIVTGTVELNVLDGQIEATEIYMQLTGEVGYKKEETVHKPHHESHTKTTYHHEPFYKVKASFALPKPEETKVIYKEGKYSWPFNISFIDELPPSISQPRLYPHVKYYLQVRIARSWYELMSETKYLTVYPKMNIPKDPQCLSSIFFGNHNRKDITVNGTLDKTRYVPGEIIHATIEIKNPQRVTITSIHLSMFQSYQIKDNSDAHYVFETTLPRMTNNKDEHIQDEFSVLIPAATLPPSYKFQGGIDKVHSVDLHYMLRFAVKVEGFFTDFDIDIPVSIGTEPAPELNHEQMSDLVVAVPSEPPQEPTIATDDLIHKLDLVMRVMKAVFT